ncbi:MAG: hypothetical protein ACR2M2_09995 [Gaiellaceae bacterium]
MRRFAPATLMLTAVALLWTVVVGVGSVLGAAEPPPARSAANAVVKLKDAKLNIEHNATDEDTGFQGFIDSEGWRRLDVRGPGGKVLRFEGRGALAKLGVTELFFETVEPENADVPIDEMLAKLPEGNYTIARPSQENGKSAGRTSGTALLTHDIPAGPMLVAPVEGAKVPTHGVVARWKPVTKTITGDPVRIIAYQLIIERDAEPAPVHDRQARAQHLRAALGDEHRRSGRVPPAPDCVQVGSAGDRAKRQPDALVRVLPDTVRAGTVAG